MRNRRHVQGCTIGGEEPRTPQGHMLGKTKMEGWDEKCPVRIYAAAAVPVAAQEEGRQVPPVPQDQWE